ncbi:MAG: trigger factor [Myxococcaceae bacterium]|nr:trigger factor [Myxococcaceae bacterium]
MKVKVEAVSAVEKRLSIEVEAAVVEQELTQAYSQLSRQVKIAGFRPGKVPRRILEQRYKADVESDVLRRVQLKAFLDAIQEHKVAAIADPHISGGKLAPSQPYAFVANVEVKPEVTAKDYKGLSLKKFEASVPAEKVKEQLEKLRESRTELKTVEGRTEVKAGDLVEIEFTATIDGKPFPGNTGSNTTVEVAPGELVKGNLEKLAGAVVGTPKTIDYTFPADFGGDEVKGKTAQFVVTAKAIKEKVVPALDDAFAEKMGVGTLKDLEGKVREDLEKSAKQTARADERQNIFEALIAKNPFDVPATMIDRGVDLMLRGALETLYRGGVDPRQLGMNFDSLRSEFRPRAEREVRGELLLESIVAQEKVEATDADLEKKLEELAAETGQPLANIRKQLKSEDARQNLVSRVLEEKAIAILKAAATYS